MRNVYRFILLLFVLSALACSIPPPKPDAQTILENSQSRHDPEAQWSNIELNLHIQEPRVQNTGRYSEVQLDNANGTFSLQRSRETSVATYQIDAAGNNTVLLNGNEQFPDSLKEKYMLDPARCATYQNFYQIMYGLPMTLNDSFLAQLGDAEKTYFNNTPCYKIPATLQEEMFSKDWILYISRKDFTFKGMEIIFPEEPTKGERLFFEGEIAINGVKIPRYRHWYELKDNEYAGSDIIVKML